MSLHPVIMAGGSGTRLWPLSREFYPKPFLALSDNNSMLQETILRLDGIEGVVPPIVVCNEEHRFLIAEHARQVDSEPDRILLEPVGRNTAPALTLGALSLAEQAADDDDPIMLVLPADHIIENVDVFKSAVRLAAKLAEGECVVTFGITPDSPHTGLGYIHQGAEYSVPGCNGSSPNGVAYELARFVEKPDLETAQQMVATEEYLWNSGMFVMRTSVWLEELERFRPDIAEACRAAYEKGTEDGLFYRPDADLFAECPVDTIDYAVMERIAGSSSGGSHQAVVVPMDANWSDVGSWAAILDVSAKDADGNVLHGDVYTHDVKDSMVFADQRLVASVGLENVIVVETADAVLVADRHRVEEVRSIVDKLREEGRSEHEYHRRVHRPWGWYETVDFGPRFQVKRITVKPGAALSLQMHHHRAEHWVVVSGTAKVTKAGEEFLLYENQSAYVQVGDQHRLENPGTIPLEIIEVQSGSYLGEDDIVRFEDRYNRHK